MPNRPVHDVIGGISGGVDSLRLAAASTTPYPSTEVIAGIVGGVLGSRFPDIVDPPTSPNHRGAAHSILAGAAALSVPISEWQGACRRLAAEHEHRMLAKQEGSFDRFVQQIAVWFWHFLAGLIAGIRAGYVSHLALDATTSAALPLIGA